MLDDLSYLGQPLFLYLLAMDSLCDQGGENFIFGICQITDLLPF
ncbi:PhoP/PhoQ regulator MgrB [Providencia stuartii]|nr:PhoP/PhoQ regulator MgrB [Providencia stuartii]MEB3133742.1 PhoP/PhoQ regulator MgrB [Providencia stuartii]